ncbi:MAG: Hsp20/alpha crystallin family protein [Bacteroidetes bacterium]|nr:MAG: Hsp20/alpha crystallin family protein [Bacteroidota bacterium]
MLLAKRVQRPSTSLSKIFENFFNEDMMNFPTQFNKTVPAVNIRENEDGFSLEVAAPGLNKEDFSIELNDNVLVISSSKNTENEVNEDNYTRREFSYEAFQRAFTLPETVDVTKINAKYENGILVVDLPKKEEAKPQPARTIKVG